MSRGLHKGVHQEVHLSKGRSEWPPGRCFRIGCERENVVPARSRAGED